MHAEAGPAIALAKQGYFFVGGHYFETKDGRFMSDQMYVKYQIPLHHTHSYPLVLFSGGGQSGLNYEGTPDGREGWADYFLRQGYAVYVLDQPARARSPYHPDAVGPTLRTPTLWVERQFTAPERFNRWPQAKLHTQWPGAGVEGDPIFDQLMGQQFPTLASFPKQQELNRDAGSALLDRIGPAILLTHSQSSAFGWLIADARPQLVKGIVAIEPNGPPAHELVNQGAPDWFEDGPLTRPYGLTTPQLAYDPPLAPGEQLTFVRKDHAGTPDLALCWEQAEPARKLVNLEKIPVLLVQSEASYHAPYDYCTVRYLRQAGVENTTYIKLADLGIHGNGHMMMLEK
ncbi:alpha/beta hydrolase [Undibacterium arcticum]|uniref:alpha/beta hydrolase n=1 Tax=Undibacterium arcticum TaxID=1762892 RepID=UPI0036191B5D